MSHTVIKMENGGTLHLLNRVFENPSEKQGLFIPTEVTDRLIKQIRDKTLFDDHETLNAMALRAQAVVEGEYQWTGDPDFEKLRVEVLNFYSFSYWNWHDNPSQECNPEFLFSMGRLYTIVQQLTDYLYYWTDKEPLATDAKILYSNLVEYGESKERVDMSLYKNEKVATDYWVVSDFVPKQLVDGIAKLYFDKPFKMRQVWILGKNIYQEKPNPYCNKQVWCITAL